MNQILKECALDEPCSYIPGRSQSIYYKIIRDCTKEQCESLILRGWRRFGAMYFRPICSDCQKCESLKIDVASYEFRKSERRILRKNSDLRTVIREPTLTRDHMELFEKYHLYKHHTRSWDEPKVDPRNYYASFVQGHGDFGYEILYFEGERLIAVDLVDILDHGISALYCYYDPELPKRSLGKYTLLMQIELARKLDLQWIYLGYYVQECVSLSYKADYQPALKLEGRPEETDECSWNPFNP